MNVLKIGHIFCQKSSLEYPYIFKRSRSSEEEIRKSFEKNVPFSCALTYTSIVVLYLDGK